MPDFWRLPTDIDFLSVWVKVFFTELNDFYLNVEFGDSLTLAIKALCFMCPYLLDDVVGKG